MRLVPDDREYLHKALMATIAALRIGTRNRWNVLPHPMNAAKLRKRIIKFLNNELAVFLVQSIFARFKVKYERLVLLIRDWNNANPPFWKL